MNVDPAVDSGGPSYFLPHSCGYLGQIRRDGIDLDRRRCSPEIVHALWQLSRSTQVKLVLTLGEVGGLQRCRPILRRHLKDSAIERGGFLSKIADLGGQRPIPSARRRQ